MSGLNKSYKLFLIKTIICITYKTCTFCISYLTFLTPMTYITWKTCISKWSARPGFLCSMYDQHGLNNISGQLCMHDDKNTFIHDICNLYGTYIRVSCFAHTSPNKYATLGAHSVSIIWSLIDFKSFPRWFTIRESNIQ